MHTVLARLGTPLTFRLIWLNRSEKRSHGSLLTVVKKSCREREPVPVQADEAGPAEQEEGAVTTSRAPNAVPWAMTPAVSYWGLTDFFPRLPSFWRTFRLTGRSGAASVGSWSAALGMQGWLT